MVYIPSPSGGQLWACPGSSLDTIYSARIGLRARGGCIGRAIVDWSRSAGLAWKDPLPFQGPWWECVAGEEADSQPRLCSPLLTLFLLLLPLPTRGLALLSPIAPECFCVKPSHLHCGIEIHKGWINCTLVNSSSTMIKIYIPIFSSTLVRGWGGHVS